MESAARPSPLASVEPFPEPFEMLPRDLEFEARQKRRMQNRIAQRNSRDRRRSKQKNQQHQQPLQTALTIKDNALILPFDNSAHQEYVTPPCSSSPSSCWSPQDSTVTSPASTNQVPQCDLPAIQMGVIALDSENTSMEMIQRSHQRSASLPGSQAYHPCDSSSVRGTPWEDTSQGVFSGSAPLYIPTTVQPDTNQSAAFDIVHHNQHINLGPAQSNTAVPPETHPIPWSIRQLAETYTRAPPVIPTSEHPIYQALLPHMQSSNPATAERAGNSRGHPQPIEPHLQGTTPLHVAAKSGNDSIVHFLLQSGADVNALDISGLTPLYLAVESGHVQTVCILLQAGADTTFMNGFS